MLRAACADVMCASSEGGACVIASTASPPLRGACAEALWRPATRAPAPNATEPTCLRVIMIPPPPGAPLDLAADAETLPCRPEYVIVYNPGPHANSPTFFGFAAANNLGVDRCADCEYVALLNPDAFPEPEWLETLLAAAGRHPEYAMFGSRLLLEIPPDMGYGPDGQGSIGPDETLIFVVDVISAT